MVYDSAEIETRWQARWRDARVFDAEVDDSREKFYCLEMFFDQMIISNIAYIKLTFALKKLWLMQHLSLDHNGLVKQN